MDAIEELEAYVLGLVPASQKGVLEELQLVEELPEGTAAPAFEDPAALEQFLRAAAEGLLEMAESAEGIDDDWAMCLSTIFHCICMLTLKHQDEELVTLLLQNVMPVLIRCWRAKIVPLKRDRGLEGAANWPKSLWAVITRLVGEGAGPEDTARSLMILSRALSMFLPYAKDTGVAYDQFRQIGFDLRREDGIAFLLLDGLEMDAPVARKETLRILRTIVTFSTVVADDPATIDAGRFEDEDSAVRIFCWQPAQKQAWIECWTNFFLLYDSIQQPQVHIIQPMLPLLQVFLQRGELAAPWLGMSWWQTLLTRAFRNDSTAVRRTVLESVLGLPEEAFPALRSAQGYVFGRLLELCDISAFYFPLDTTTLSSRFGEAVVSFYSRYLGAYPADLRAAAINEYVLAVCARVRAPNPAVYLLQALLVLPAQPALTEAALEAAQRFAGSTSTFHNLLNRRLVKWQLLRALVLLGDAAQIPYRAVSAAVEFLTAELEDFGLASRDYVDLAEWLDAAYGADSCEQSLRNEVERYFAEGGASMEEHEGWARRIASMAALSLRAEGAFARCCEPAYRHMQAISSRMDRPEFVVRALLLFIRLDEAVRKTTAGATGSRSCAMRGCSPVC